MRLKDHMIKVVLMLTYVKILSSFRKVLCKSVLVGYYYAVAHLVAALCYAPECRLFDSRWGPWDFLLIPSRPHCGPGVDSAFNRNKYQVFRLGIKTAGV